METLEDQIITLQIKNDELKDEVETITKELKEIRNSYYYLTVGGIKNDR